MLDFHRKEKRLAPSPAVFRFGVFDFDARSGELRKRGARVRVQQQPLEVLAALLAGRGELITRERLREALWPNGTYVDFDRSLNKAIVKLRDALGDDATSPRFIETVPRLGYRFIAPVETASGAGEPAAFPAGRRRRLAVAAASLLALAAFVAILRRQGTPGDSDSKPVRSLAVLPFDNLSGDPSQEFFSDGLTDELITELAQLRSVRVVSRTSVMRFKGAREPLPKIARALNVEALVEGAVVRGADRVRITVHLVRAGDDRDLWARTFDSPAKDVVALQGEVASAIAHRIGIEIAPETEKKLHRRSPTDPRAFDLYLRARHLFHTRHPDDERGAVELFIEALRLDPNYAEAYAGRAECFSFLSYEGALLPGEGYARARNDAQTALKIDESLSEAHAALAAVLFFSDWNIGGTEAELRRAISLEPGNAEAHQWLAHVLLVEGKPEAALAEIRVAEELDPLASTAHNVAGGVLYALRRDEDALAEFREAGRLDPSWAASRWLAGDVLWAAGRYREALGSYQDAARLLANPRLEGAISDSFRLLNLRGHAAVAREFLSFGKVEASLGTPRLQAKWHARIGDRDDAFRLLGRAVDDRDPNVLELGWTPDFESLRSDPRYAALIRRIGLPGGA